MYGLYPEFSEPSQIKIGEWVAFSDWFVMKRTYSNRELDSDSLPKFKQGDPGLFRTTLCSNYELKVLKIYDISKPPEKPVDEIEEPEDDEAATESRLNKNSARMLLIHLRDSSGTEIKALEVERIEALTQVQSNWTISIIGPVEVRCGNIMLERKNVVQVQPPKNDENPQVDTVPPNTPASNQAQMQTNNETARTFQDVIHIGEDWDEADEDECIIIDWHNNYISSKPITDLYI